MLEQTFYSGRDSNGQLCFIDPSLIMVNNYPAPNAGCSFCKLMIPKLPSEPEIINYQKWLINILSTLIILNFHIDTVYKIDQTIRTNGFIPFDYKYELKNIIHTMKWIIDQFIMINSIKFDVLPKNISITSIGNLLSDSYKNKTLLNSVRNAMSYEKFQYIMSAINDLHNAYKHDFITNEADALFGQNGPTLCAYYLKHGDFEHNPIKFLNHSFSQIVMGFNDWLCDVTGYLNFTSTHSYRQYEMSQQ